MAVTTTMVAIAGLALSAVGMVQQQSAAKKQAANQQAQAEEMRQQAQLEDKRAEIQNTRALRTAVRQSRIARAIVTNIGANVGTSGSSGVQGGVASIGAQTAANQGYFSAMQGINTGVTASQQVQGGLYAQAGDIQGDAAIGGAFTGLGSTIFSSAGGFKTIFDATK